MKRKTVEELDAMIESARVRRIAIEEERRRKDLLYKEQLAKMTPWTPGSNKKRWTPPQLLET